MRIEFERSLVLEKTINKLRDENTEAAVFRKYLRQLGILMGYELGKLLENKAIEIKTPLAMARGLTNKHDMVIVSVLRAAQIMAEGVLELFDDASLGIVSASRGEMIGNDGTEFQINANYSKIPAIEGKDVIIVDPMLATGSTIKYILGQIAEQKPASIYLITAIASEFGVNAIETAFPHVHILSAAIDSELNEIGYIVPGLGDAGDRAWNTEH